MTVRIPSAMRAATGGEGRVAVEGSTVDQALRSLVERHPGVKGRLFDGAGALRGFVNVFVDEEDIRFSQGLATPVAEGQTVSILPAVSGGSG